MFKNHFLQIGIVLLVLSISVGILLSQKRVQPNPYNNPPTPTKNTVPAVSISPTIKLSDENNYTSWKIETVCLPIQSWSAAGFEPFIDLKDGTLIYKRVDETLFRGTVNRCRCLASNTKISTPQGETPVTQLKEGDAVWSIDKNGKKISSKLIKITSITVSSSHKVSHLILFDGRELYVSPEHPTTMGNIVTNLKVGNSYDNSIVKSNLLISYWDNKTYDILPDSDTSYYWANGILMGSTLKD